MKNDWEKKATCSAYLAKCFPLEREIWRVALPWVRANGPTDPLHISCICSIWKLLHFYSSLSLNPSKSAFFHVLTFSSDMQFIVYKQCAQGVLKVSPQQRTRVQKHKMRISCTWRSQYWYTSIVHNTGIKKNIPVLYSSIVPVLLN